ncbi:hypothetical protein GGR56DRAFT_566892 [Xylariaceae sp. FL0804]|nr:hypothetical protein GGR56DRAFT_566892 [Xylariaceae sp. FL0804]
MEPIQPEEPPLPARTPWWRATKNSVSPEVYEQYERLRAESRLSMPAVLRIPLAAFAAFGVGMSIGLAQGSKMSGLRFRAEHAHRLPTNVTGWYLYHKSKNYHMALGGIKQGFRTGAKLSALSTAMFCVENMMDLHRGTRDFANTVVATMAIAGCFSVWNGFSAVETARTARKGLTFGLFYGVAQDLLALARGRPVSYVEFIKKQIGKRSQLQEEAV